MATGDEQTSWTLNLDITDALESLGKFQEGMSGAVKTDGLSDLIKKFSEVGLTLGAIAAAAFALKETMDLVFEGENIEAINQQFETLSKNAGIAGESLKKAMTEAAGGLIDDERLVKEMNRGIVELGGNATHLAEVMTVARQATAVMGGNVSDNYNQIVQAIASGRTQMLRSMGIIVDQEKAYKDYAKSIGVATDELTREGKQHAILNAVLDKSKEAFAGINPNVKEAQNSFEALKVSITEIKDVLILAFEKVAGPTLANFFKNLKGWTEEAKTWLQANLGGGAEAATAKTKILEEQLLQLKGKLSDLEVYDKRGFLDRWFGPAKEEQIKKLKLEIIATEGELNGLHAKSGEKHIETEHKVTAQHEIDLDRRAKNELKFQQELDKIREKNLSDEMKLAQSEDQVNKIHQQQKLLLEKQTSDQIARIKMQEGLTARQREMMITEVHKSSTLKQKQMDEDLEKQRIQSLDNYLKHSESVTQGVSRAFEVGAKKNEKNLHDFAMQGQKAFDSFGSHAKSAFEDMGAGTKTAGDAMKDMALGVVADMAEQYGEFLLLSSIWPPNPAGAAAGAALLMLAGYLRSQSSNSSTSSAGGGAGGGAGGSSSNSSEYGFGTTTTNNESPTVGSLQQAPQKTVNVTVQGNYYDSNESKMAIMDMIRQATDATDFNYYKVGGQ